ncbi:acid sphingomyelinase-like phosphodiesterase 3a isoform X2 [Mercenaria mercenaria]|nr:acid sphingomyelinase-like phosphodiesterase 3a isoform X2 [Mercenaria mercenaria]
MADIRSNVDFVLWTGDTVLHGKDKDLSYTINAGILDNVTDVIQTTLPGVPVYATFGNHDYWPNNQFPPHNNLLYNETLDNRWRQWLNDSSQDDNFRKGAYYTKTTRYGLRIVALNTNLYYTSNKAILNYTDPADQIAWLNSTLSQARANQEKVLITAHIPPGVHTPNGLIWMHLVYHRPLVAVMRDYTDIIVAMHFGHDHADGFKVLKNNKGEAAVPIFMAPSVTPWRYKIPQEIGPAHNPGIRLVKYDRSTGGHLEIQQYYLDLVKANKNGFASWELEYNTSSHYGLSTLTATTLLKLAEKMKKPTSNEFKNYWKFYTVTPPTNLQDSCDEDCHSSIICGFTEFEMEDFKSCKTNMVSNAWRPSNFLIEYLFVLVSYLALW